MNKEAMNKELSARELEMDNISRMPWIPREDELFSAVKEPENHKGKGTVFRLPAHYRRELSAPFPPEAIKEYTGKGSGKLSTIKAMYIYERMNSVFGMLGWAVEEQIVGIFDTPEREKTWRKDKNGKIIKNDWGRPQEDKDFRTGKPLYTYRHLVMRVRIYIRQFDLYTPWHYGGCELDDYNQSVSDGFKKAMTDAFTKVAGNYLEIGVQIFKGKPNDISPNVQAKFTAEEEAEFKNRYLKDVYGTTDVPEEAQKSYQNPESRNQELPEEGEKGKTVDFEKERKAAGSAMTADEKIEKKQSESLSKEERVNKMIEKINACDNAQEVKKMFDDMGIDYSDYSDITGNQRFTQKGAAIYITEKYGEPNEKAEPEAPKEEAPKEEAPKEEAPKEENDSDGINLDDPDEPNDNVSKFVEYKNEVNSWGDYETFASSYKQLWTDAKKDFENDLLTHDDLKELKSFIENIGKQLKKNS
jgi:hypothetical protein